MLLLNLLLFALLLHASLALLLDRRDSRGLLLGAFALAGLLGFGLRLYSFGLGSGGLLFVLVLLDYLVQLLHPVHVRVEYRGVLRVALAFALAALGLVPGYVL